MRINNQANAMFAAVANRCDRSVEAGIDVVRHHHLPVMRLYPTTPTGTTGTTRLSQGLSAFVKPVKPMVKPGQRTAGLLWRSGQPSQVGSSPQSIE